MKSGQSRPAIAGGLIGVLSLALAGCGSEEQGAQDDLTSAAVLQYSKIAYATYQDSHGPAFDLADIISEMLDNPTDAWMSDARDAWLNAREPYLQTEVFRFYQGPIDDPDGGPEGLINAWPLDEAYIDYVEGDETAGVINNVDVTIDAETIEGLNEAGGERNIATGFHAIEFLLWGQDLSEAGPGDRPVTDYVTDGSGTHENQDRRGEYLRVVSEMLVGHLEGLADAWAAGRRSNYRADFEAADPSEGLRRILTGMIVLSGFETGGERLQTALDSGMQEDEHSCFSDNTTRDMVGDILGIQNVWNGSYIRINGSRVEGTGVREVVASADAGLAEQLDEQIAESLELAEALEAPFDREIALDNDEGRQRVADLITALGEQEQSLEDVFRLLDLTVPDPE